MAERPPRPATTVYLYELAWILPSIAIPVGMLVALTVTAFGVGVHMPSDEGRVDVSQLDQTPPFDQPGLVALGPGRYEVRMVAGIAVTGTVDLGPAPPPGVRDPGAGL